MTGRRRPDRSWWSIVVPALLAYVPLLLTKPGVVGADTKTYLYLDPGRLLSDAPYLWDSGTGAGTITHQNIGYLWPMGPWYWVFETLNVPDWMAQRLWLGTVLFLAALGVRQLLRRLGWRGEGGILVASLAYMLSPYVLDYGARISVILLPWAGLGWLVLLTVRSLREGGWRWPAAFALVVLTVGGVNATALLMVAPAVVLWVVWAIWVDREVAPVDAARTLGRMAVLTLATSLWWIAGLWAQGRHGLPILRYTESYKTIAEASSPPEVLRGLGYWFFYGRDKLGPWIEPTVDYTNRLWLLGLSYAVPVAALASAAMTRWRHRSYFLALIVVGGLLAVGAHPWENSSPAGAVFKEFTKTDAGLALRSTPRAVPLVVLGMAVCLGAGVTALGRRIPRLAVPATVLVSLALFANLAPMWMNETIADNLQRPEDVPEYWADAASDLDAAGDATRILEIPGTEFASYRWGNTVDPITPGLLDRPYLARELFAYGTPPSQGLLIALDRRYHENLVDEDALATVARLFGIGDVVLRSDLQYERYRTARPRPTWALLTSTPGLGDPTSYGELTPNRAGPEQPLIDEIELAEDPDLEDPPPVAVFPVEDPTPLLRAESAAHPLVLSGGPEGLVDAAGAELLTAGQPLFYSASFADDRTGLDRLLDAGADLLVTDTHRKRARRWGALQQNTGYTERAGEEPPSFDPTDNRLDLFSGVDDDAYTVTEQRGPVVVTATDYGNPVTYTADDRAANALDASLETAWRVGAFADVQGERLRLDFDEPTTADRIRLVQPQNGIVNRVITSVALHFDGRRGPVFGLTPESETAEGQEIAFDEETFERVEIEILETNVGRRPRYDGVSAVGFADVDIGGAAVEEIVRPPVDLLGTLGDRSIDHRLGYLFTRLRSNPAEPVRLDEEPWLSRLVSVPAGRAFAVAGDARLSSYVTDEVIDGLVGIPTADGGGVTAVSSARLPGSLRNRASAAIDGDPETFWSPPFEKQAGHFIDLTFAEPVTFDHLDLQLVTDGRHSVPRRILLRPDGDDASVRAVDVPELADGDTPNEVTEFRAEFDPMTATSLRVAIDDVRDVETIDWHSSLDTIMPIGIAEVGLPGVTVSAPASEVDSGCRDDLVTLRHDGSGADIPVEVRIAGPVDEALDRGELAIEPCAGSLDGVDLRAGDYVLQTSPGMATGFDVDQLYLGSEQGGEPMPIADATEDRPADPPISAAAETGRVSAELRVEGATEPYWVVLGQSYGDGWRAEIDGGPSLGAPTLVDGYANGWLVDPDEVGEDARISITWGPQRVIWGGLAASAVGVLACLALVVLGARRPRTPVIADPTPAADQPTDRPVSVRRAILAAAGLGVLAVLALPPPGVAAVLVAALTYVALRRPRGRLLLAGGAAVSLGTAGAYFVVQQARLRHPPDFIWPQQFDAVDILGLLTILLLAAEVVREVAVTRRSHGPRTIGRADEPEREGSA